MPQNILLSKAQSFNNNNRKYLSRLFNFCNAILVLLTISWVAVISMFIGDGMFDYNEGINDPIHTFALAYLFFGLVVLLSIIKCGHTINQKDEPSLLLNASFGFFIILVGVIPFFTEAAALHQVSHLNDDFKRINGMKQRELLCELNKDETININDFKIVNDYTSIIMNLAKKYDRQNEVLLDKHMCTPICPCFSAPKWSLDDKGNKIKRIDAEYKYLALSEQMLNKHHRTRD